MRRREFMALICGAATCPIVARAQQPAGKVARIGMLGPASGDPLVEAFKQGLRELGYVEGENISIEYRWAEGRSERLPGLVAEFRPPDIAGLHA